MATIAASLEKQLAESKAEVVRTQDELTASNESMASVKNILTAREAAVPVVLHLLHIP
jgi:hypothetical protein